MRDACLTAGQNRGLLLQIILLFGLGNLNLLINEAEQVSLLLRKLELALADIGHVHIDVDVDQVQISALHSRLHRLHRLHRIHKGLNAGHPRRQQMILGDLMALRAHDPVCILANRNLCAVVHILHDAAFFDLLSHNGAVPLFRKRLCHWCHIILQRFNFIIDGPWRAARLGVAGVAARFPLGGTGDALVKVTILGHLARLGPPAAVELLTSLGAFVDVSLHAELLTGARTPLLVRKDARKAHRITSVGRDRSLLGSKTV